jgi:hypothetical protein
VPRVAGSKSKWSEETFLRLEEMMPDPAPYKYDKQFVLTFLGPDVEKDKAHFRPQREALQKKGLTKGIATQSAICQHVPNAEGGETFGYSQSISGLAELTSISRLYLLGHGNWARRTLGGWTYDDVIKILRAGPLRAAKVVNVIGCDLARDLKTDAAKPMNDDWKDSWISSFCTQLHKALLEDLKVKTEVRGYL